MQVIKYIEDKFETFSLKVKIELFLFPLLIFSCLIFLFYEEANNEKKEKVSFEKININNIKMKENIVDILKNIEFFAQKENIHLENITSHNKTVKIEAYGSLKKRIIFLNYLENYNSFSKLASLEILDEMMFVEIDFKKIYKKEKNDLALNLDSFENEKNLEFKLEAIVGNKAFINNKWLELNEMIGSLKVSRIENDNVVLKNKYKTLILKLYKNETI